MLRIGSSKKLNPTLNTSSEKFAKSNQLDSTLKNISHILMVS